jgi:hypothetical protein
MNFNNYQLAKINNSRIIDLEEKYENNYEGEEEDDTLFSDDNEEFIGFKSNVKEWLMLDDDIITLQKAVKERKLKKDELTPKILNFMDKFNINDLNTEGGKIKFTKSLYTKPLNKQFLISKLGDFFKDFRKGEKAASFILENRDKEERCKIRRVLNKK